MQIYIVKPKQKDNDNDKDEKKQETKENILKSNVMLDLYYVLGI